MAQRDEDCAQTLIGELDAGGEVPFFPVMAELMARVELPLPQATWFFSRWSPRLITEPPCRPRTAPGSSSTSMVEPWPGRSGHEDGGRCRRGGRGHGRPAARGPPRGDCWRRWAGSARPTRPASACRPSGRLPSRRCRPRGRRLPARARPGCSRSRAGATHRTTMALRVPGPVLDVALLHARTLGEAARRGLVPADAWSGLKDVAARPGETAALTRARTLLADLALD